MRLFTICCVLRLCFEEEGRAGQVGGVVGGGDSTVCGDSGQPTQHTLLCFGSVLPSHVRKLVSKQASFVHYVCRRMYAQSG
jgi:hypothetical protein